MDAIEVSLYRKRDDYVYVTGEYQITFFQNKALSDTWP